eukprot:7722461-Pyramimonas_sp.AAC.1
MPPVGRRARLRSPSSPALFRRPGSCRPLRPPCRPPSAPGPLLRVATSKVPRTPPPLFPSPAA